MKHRFITGMFLALLLALCSCTGNDARSDEGTTAESTPLNTDSTQQESMQIPNTTEEQTMTVILNGKSYAVSLDSNTTTTDIISKLPLDLSLVRYAGHEYYAELPFTPVFDETRTSEIKAGHIYYWDGWNAFVINYIDYDIAPYKVVHIGEITDKSIIDFLSGADEKIDIQVTQ